VKSPCGMNTLAECREDHVLCERGRARGAKGADTPTIAVWPVVPGTAQIGVMSLVGSSPEVGGRDAFLWLGTKKGGVVAIVRGAALRRLAKKILKEMP